MTKIVTSISASDYEEPLDSFKFQLHNVCENLDLKDSIMDVPFPSLIGLFQKKSKRGVEDILV